MPSCVRLHSCQEHSLQRLYPLALSQLTAALKEGTLGRFWKRNGSPCFDLLLSEGVSCILRPYFPGAWGYFNCLNVSELRESGTESSVNPGKSKSSAQLTVNLLFPWAGFPIALRRGMVHSRPPPISLATGGRAGKRESRAGGSEFTLSE